MKMQTKVLELMKEGFEIAFINFQDIRVRVQMKYKSNRITCDMAFDEFEGAITHDVLDKLAEELRRTASDIIQLPKIRLPKLPTSKNNPN